MARITVEDCLKQIPNRFELVIDSGNREVVVALREVAATQVRKAPLKELTPA